MQLKSLDGCRLKIGSYPRFSYNASGGGGKGTLNPSEKEIRDGTVFKRFKTKLGL